MTALETFTNSFKATLDHGAPWNACFGSGGSVPDIGVSSL